MFGYVMPVESELPSAYRDVFRAAYCGVCHAMGPISRFALSYDCAFLALCLSGLTGGQQASTARCKGHPFRKVPVAVNDYTAYAGDINVLLAYYNLSDDIQDEGGVRKRVARALLHHAYAGARRRRRQVAECMEQQLARLAQLEAQHSDDTDLTAGCFATLLQAVAAPGADFHGPLGRMFYNLGRWIYLIDALMDYEKDEQQGAYNVLRLRYGSLQKAREQTSFSLWYTLSQVEHCLMQCAPHESVRPVLLHIVQQALPARTLVALDEGGWDAESL